MEQKNMKKVDAIEAFGSVKALADALDIWPQAVHKWPEDVPPLRAYQINEILDNREEKGSD
jgi:hypothetical protein